MRAIVTLLSPVESLYPLGGTSSLHWSRAVPSLVVTLSIPSAGARRAEDSPSLPLYALASHPPGTRVARTPPPFEARPSRQRSNPSTAGVLDGVERSRGNSPGDHSLRHPPLPH